MGSDQKLLSLLKTLDSTELKRFSLYLESPYWVRYEGLLPLLQAFIPFLLGEQSTPPAEVELYKLVFPGQPFDRKRLSYPLHYLDRELERFLGLEFYQKQGFQQQINTLKALSNRKQEKHVRRSRTRLEKARSEFAQHQETYWQEELELQLLSGQEAFQNGDIAGYHKFNQQASDCLDELYFLRRLKFSCERLNDQRIFSISFDHPFSEEVIRFLSRRPGLQPITAMYFHIYHTLVGENEDFHFDSLLNLIQEHQHKFAQTDMREVYLFALNFCIRKFRGGLKDFADKALFLYQEGISSGILFDGLYLSSRTFTNAIKQALVLGKYDWIENFIDEYGEKLAPNNRRDTLCYNLADYYYHIQQYDQVLDQLKLLRFSDLHYHLGSRVLLLKTYYQMDAMDSLLSLLASFSIYLRRKKELSQGLKRTYLNFCKLLHKVLILSPSDPKERIRKEIQETTPLAERAWLNELVSC